MKPPAPSTSEGATEEKVVEPSLTPTFFQCEAVWSVKKPAVPPWAPPMLTQKRLGWLEICEVFEV